MHHKWGKSVGYQSFSFYPPKHSHAYNVVLPPSKEPNLAQTQLIWWDSCLSVTGTPQSSVLQYFHCKAGNRVAHALRAHLPSCPDVIPSAPVKTTVLPIQTWAETCPVSIPIYHLAKPRLKSSHPACQSSAQSITPHCLRSAGWLQPYCRDFAACFALWGPGKRDWVLLCSEQLGRGLEAHPVADSTSCGRSTKPSFQGFSFLPAPVAAGPGRPSSSLHQAGLILSPVQPWLIPFLPTLLRSLELALTRWLAVCVGKEVVGTGLATSNEKYHATKNS